MIMIQIDDVVHILQIMEKSYVCTLTRPCRCSGRHAKLLTLL